MAVTIIDGKGTAASMREALARRVERMREAGLTPGLAVVIVGDDPASKVYVGQKEKACAAAGIYSEKHALPADATEAELLQLVSWLNRRDDIHGILVQLPLPPHMDASAVIDHIRPYKDVDGFHPENVGRMVVGGEAFRPCTPHGVMRLLDEHGVELEGAEAVVVGRSNIVGKPLALMLLERNATVTVCHSRTRDLEAHLARADIVLVAVGRAEMVKGAHIKPGAVVIDVGVNRLENGKLVGDVEFDSAAERASAITPVPGGVGPMTIAMLLENTVAAATRFAGMEGESL